MRCSYRFVNYFFFSSRRRHTRLQGDWSSDVCSSDLQQAAVGQAGERIVEGQAANFLFGGLALALVRSEEHTSELQSPCNLVCRLLLEKNSITAFLLLLYALLRGTAFTSVDISPALAH